MTEPNSDSLYSFCGTLPWNKDTALEKKIYVILSQAIPVVAEDQVHTSYLWAKCIEIIEHKRKDGAEGGMSYSWALL